MISTYDALASSFDRHRVLPGGVPEAIRATVLASLHATSRPRLLDLGAGTGRIGEAFVAAGDDYVGVDLSLGMLQKFAQRGGANGDTLRLVQADGERLPFRDATFDAVMLIQVIGAAQSWQTLVAEAQRILRVRGALVIGHLIMPPDGLDAQMKKRLALFLEEMGVQSYHMNRRSDAQYWLSPLPQNGTRVIAAAWLAKRTPEAFLHRQRTGARFSALPHNIKEAALSQLRTWALATFGSLNAEFEEKHYFELRVFKFEGISHRC